MTAGQETMLKELHTAIIGNEQLGHVGLVKRMSVVEAKIESHDPIIKDAMEKKVDSKKLRNTIIAGVITFIAGITTHIIIILSH